MQVLAAYTCAAGPPATDAWMTWHERERERESSGQTVNTIVWVSCVVRSGTGTDTVIDSDIAHEFGATNQRDLS